MRTDDFVAARKKVDGLRKMIANSNKLLSSKQNLMDFAFLRSKASCRPTLFIFICPVRPDTSMEIDGVI